MAGTDEVLNNGVLSANIGGTLSFTVTNVPYAAYSVVVYDLAASRASCSPSRPAGSASSPSVPTPVSAGYLDGNAATPFTYLQGTGLSAATATANADYVLFPLLTGSTLTISAVATSGNAQIAGFQIINAVPEPSTYALALLGGAAVCSAPCGVNAPSAGRNAPSARLGRPPGSLTTASGDPTGLFCALMEFTPRSQS